MGGQPELILNHKRAVCRSRRCLASSDGGLIQLRRRIPCAIWFGSNAPL